MSEASELRVALVSIASSVGDTGFNLERHYEWLCRAVEGGAEVVGFPECSLTGYLGGAETAIKIDSEPIRRVRGWAVEFGVHVLVGLAEREAEALYSSCALIGPSGLVGVVRKINCIPEESGIYGSGREFPVFEVRGRRIGVAVCGDASVYEVPKILALRGAEIVFAPHANAHPGLRGDPSRWRDWRRRSWARFLPDWGTFLLGCNLARLPGGDEWVGERKYAGGLLALGPHGELLAESAGEKPGEAMVVVDIPRCVNPARELFGCLRPDILYGSHGWVFGRSPGESAALGLGGCGGEPTRCERGTDDLPTPSDSGTYFYATAAWFHETSSLGCYPLPPTSLKFECDGVSEVSAVGRQINVSGDALTRLGGISLADALQRRRSVRQFGQLPLEPDRLGALLWAGYGLQSAATAESEYRTVPSPGGLFGLVLFVAVRNVVSVAEGVYRYGPQDGCLYALRTAPVAIESWFRTEDIEYAKAAAVIIVVARIGRVASRYGERGYRHLLLEAGHVGQNLGLAAAALDVSSVPAGGFDDRLVGRALGLAHPSEVAVHCVVIGSR